MLRGRLEDVSARDGGREEGEATAGGLLQNWGVRLRLDLEERREW